MSNKTATYTGFEFEVAGFPALAIINKDLADKSVQRLPDEEMKAVIYEMQEILAEEALFLMICPTPNVWAINKRVHDVLPIYAATGFNDWGGMQNAWVEG